MAEPTREPGSQVEQRVWARLPTGSRGALERTLPRSDLQTVLLAVARERAAAVAPAELVRRWEQDRFVRPATTDPRELAVLEGRLWELLPSDVDGVELSPVVPLGTSSALGPVSQNRVVSTARSTEVVSDSTNALAVEAAVRRRRQARDGSVHLATCQRQLRAQVFGPGASAHFRLFALVSSMRDRGSHRTEVELLRRHLTYWIDVLATLVPDHDPRIALSVFDDPAMVERVRDDVLPALRTFGPVRVVDVPERRRGRVVPERRRGRGYYAGAALRITAGIDDVELGDGGLTTWTAQLLGDAEERCLVSCLSTERVLALRAPP